MKWTSGATSNIRLKHPFKNPVFEILKGIFTLRTGASPLEADVDPCEEQRSSLKDPQELTQSMASYTRLPSKKGKAAPTQDKEEGHERASCLAVLPSHQPHVMTLSSWWVQVVTY